MCPQSSRDFAARFPKRCALAANLRVIRFAASVGKRLTTAAPDLFVVLDAVLLQRRSPAFDRSSALRPLMRERFVDDEGCDDSGARVDRRSVLIHVVAPSALASSGRPRD